MYWPTPPGPLVWSARGPVPALYWSLGVVPECSSQPRDASGAVKPQ